MYCTICFTRTPRFQRRPFRGMFRERSVVVHRRPVGSWASLLARAARRLPVERRRDGLADDHPQSPAERTPGPRAHAVRSFIARSLVRSLQLTLGGGRSTPTGYVLAGTRDVERSGLDNAGKTTICKALLGEDVDQVSPTLGFNIRTIVHRGYTLNVCEFVLSTFPPPDPRALRACKLSHDADAARGGHRTGLGRGHWRPDFAATLLAELLRADRRGRVGRRLVGSGPHGGLQAGTARLAAGRGARRKRLARNRRRLGVGPRVRFPYWSDESAERILGGAHSD